MKRGSSASLFYSLALTSVRTVTALRRLAISRSPLSKAALAAQRDLYSAGAAARSSAERYALREESASPSSYPSVRHNAPTARTMGHTVMWTGMFRSRTNCCTMIA